MESDLSPLSSCFYPAVDNKLIETTSADRATGDGIFEALHHLLELDEGKLANDARVCEIARLIVDRIHIETGNVWDPGDIGVRFTNSTSGQGVLHAVIVNNTPPCTFLTCTARADGNVEFTHTSTASEVPRFTKDGKSAEVEVTLHAALKHILQLDEKNLPNDSAVPRFGVCIAFYILVHTGETWQVADIGIRFIRSASDDEVIRAILMHKRPPYNFIVCKALRNGGVVITRRGVSGATPRFTTTSGKKGQRHDSPARLVGGDVASKDGEREEGGEAYQDTASLASRMASSVLD
tara:strand:+ start:1070 stop:1951 length:882 start_codon:yes stop_codon:yes gene_type:complete